MVKIKEMPYREKYSQVLTYIKGEERSSALIEKQLGSQAVADLQKERQMGIKRIPEDASYREKYETALSNLTWMSGTKLSFIRSRLGEDGINQLMQANVGALEEGAGPVLFLLRLIRAISPGLAFTMTARQMAYRSQALSGPLSVAELSRTRMVVDIPHCKSLDFPGGEDACITGCQRIFPARLSRHFGIEVKLDREGSHCTITVTPSK